MPEYLFKTIYFPRDRVESGKAARVNVSLPAQPNSKGISEEFISYLNGLDSRSFRLALGDPILEELEGRAHDEDRSLSNICVSILKSRFGTGQQSAQLRIVQHSLDFGDAVANQLDPPRQTKTKLYDNDGEPKENFNRSIKNWLEESERLREHSTPAAFSGLRDSFSETTRSGQPALVRALLLRSERLHHQLGGG